MVTGMVRGLLVMCWPYRRTDTRCMPGCWARKKMEKDFLSSLTAWSPPCSKSKTQSLQLVFLIENFMKLWMLSVNIWSVLIMQDTLMA